MNDRKKSIVRARDAGIHGARIVNRAFRREMDRNIRVTGRRSWGIS